MKSSVVLVLLLLAVPITLIFCVVLVLGSLLVSVSSFIAMFVLGDWLFIALVCVLVVVG